MLQCQREGFSGLLQRTWHVTCASSSTLNTQVKCYKDACLLPGSVSKQARRSSDWKSDILLITCLMLKWLWSDEVIYFTEVKLFSCLSRPLSFVTWTSPKSPHQLLSVAHSTLLQQHCKFLCNRIVLSYPNRGNLKCVLLFFQPRGVCWWSRVDLWAHCCASYLCQSSICVVSLYELFWGNRSWIGFLQWQILLTLLLACINAINTLWFLCQSTF